MRTLLIVLTCFGLLASAAMASACESDHWIDKVSDDGSIVILEDGSVWLIDPVDTATTIAWTETDDIIACVDKLINTDDREVASARQIR